MTGHPRRAKPSLSPGRRLLIHATGLLLWTSGFGWLLFHYFVRVSGEFGPTQSAYEPWWLKLHGAAAFVTLFVLGLLWGVHVLKGWASDQRRASGAGLLAVLGALSLTGYLLYYVGDDELRAAISLAHWIPGLALPAVYLVHRHRAAKARRVRHPPGRAGHKSAATEARSRRARRPEPNEPVR